MAWVYNVLPVVVVGGVRSGRVSGVGGRRGRGAEAAPRGRAITWPEFRFNDVSKTWRY